jgi:hypothetical protein
MEEQAISNFELWSGCITLVVGFLYFIRCLFSNMTRLGHQEVKFKNVDDKMDKSLRRFDKFARIFLPIIFAGVLIICAYIHGKNPSTLPISAVLSLMIALAGIIFLKWTRQVAPKLMEPITISEELKHYLEKLDTAQVIVGIICFLAIVVLHIGVKGLSAYLSKLDCLWVKALSDGTSIGGAITISIVGLLHTYKTLNRSG